MTTVFMKVTIYTINECPYCKAEKEYLSSQNIAYEEKNVEQHREFLTEMLAASDNFAGVPFTLIVKDDGAQVGLKGFTKEEFDQALGIPIVVTSAPVAATTPPTDTATPSVTPVTTTPPISDTASTPEVVSPIVEASVTTPSVVEPTVGASITETAAQPEVSTSAAAEPTTPNNSVEMGQSQTPATVGSDMANSASPKPEPTITESPAGQTEALSEQSPLGGAGTPNLADVTATQPPQSGIESTGEELKGVLNNLEALSTDAKPQEPLTSAQTPSETATVTPEVSPAPVPEMAPEQAKSTASTEPQPQPEVQTTESVQENLTAAQSAPTVSGPADGATSATTESGSAGLPTTPAPAETPTVPDFGKS